MRDINQSNKPFWIALVFVFFACVCRLYAQYSPSLRLDPDIEHFIARIGSRYRLELPRSFYCQPMQVKHVRAFLDMADSLNKEGQLSEREAFRLHRLRTVVTGRPNALTLSRPERDIESHLNLGLLGQIKPAYGDSAVVDMKGVIQPRLTGNIGPLSYFSEIDVWTEYDSDTSWESSDYQPYNGIPYNLFGRADSGNVRAADIIRGGISVNTKHFEFETAVDYVKWGPAVYNPLTFSGYAPPLTYFRGSADMIVATYSHYIGLLRCAKDKPKYFYAHRLTIPAFRKKVVFGINEVVLGGSTVDNAQTDSLRQSYYGQERTWEWVYMIPFMPYSFAEHYVGDRDNVVLSFDVSVNVPARFRWYLEFLLDDITTPLTIFSDDWGNKWALTAGVQYFGNHFGRDIDVVLEYCRVEPWVYTHFYGGSHRYTHFGESLGAPNGPNSDELNFSIEGELNNRNSLGLKAKAQRGNQNVRGGSIYHVFQDGVDSETKEFMGPGSAGYGSGELFWRMSPFGVFTIVAGVGYDSEGALYLNAVGRFLF